MFSDKNDKQDFHFSYNLRIKIMRKSTISIIIVEYAKTFFSISE